MCHGDLSFSSNRIVILVAGVDTREPDCGGRAPCGREESANRVWATRLLLMVRRIGSSGEIRANLKDRAALYTRLGVMSETYMRLGYSRSRGGSSNIPTSGIALVTGPPGTPVPE